MTFREVLGALRSRWWAAAAAMLIALGGGWLLIHPAPAYQTTAVVVLVPPKGGPAQNTLASVTPSIAAAGLAVDDVLLSAAEVGQLRGSGVTDQYTITPRNNGTDETPAYTVPSEQITVTGASATAGLREAETLVQAYGASLQSMQSSAGVRPQGQITDGLLAAPSTVELQGSRSRGLIAAGLLGLGAAIAIAVRLRPGRPGNRVRRRRPRRAGLLGASTDTRIQEQDGLFI